MPKVETFNRDVVLKQATEVFHDKGFNATSMQDLVDATGLNRSSIYNSFENKLNLYLECLKLYEDKYNRETSKRLLESSSGLEAIQLIFELYLNEMTKLGALERAEWLAPRIGNHLKKQGVVALIEPALKRPGRELMALRDHLIEPGDYSILGPCLHEKLCPMLAGTRNDWCHFYIDWQEPAYLKQLDRLIGNENRFLKLAYILLGPQADYAEKLTRPEKEFRVVSNRMATRGKTELILCGPLGRVRVTRLDRHRSKVNEALDETRRGDRIQLDALKSQEFEVNGNFRMDAKTPWSRLTKN